MKQFKYGEPSNLNLRFTNNTDLSLIPSAALNNLNKFKANSDDSSCDEIDIIKIEPIDSRITALIENKTGIKYEAKTEEFVIVAENREVTIYANALAGQIYGLMTFVRLLDSNSYFNLSFVYDYPIDTLRGIKILTPGRDEIEYYKALLDSMMYFRYNTIMIELGGAMEYKRHPEINEGWEELAAIVSEYSGKGNEIQNAYRWRKNNFQVGNGGNSYLTQDEIKQLIEYAIERGIKVIPEVPSSCHCDYLLWRHPELAERPEDPYPDTFCISNPKSYELLFDVIDEVIEVFNPEIINIGHDEFYSINVCDRCRKRLMTAADLFAEDVNKIYDYLKSKNVKTMMWCDKLQNVVNDEGNLGGALNFDYKNWDPKNELRGIIQPTYTAREKLPKDLICMNWFWSFGDTHDEEIREFPVVFGNFSGTGMVNYRKRCGNNTLGGITSNWASTQDIYLQRNMVYFNMAYNDMLYWNSEYNDTEGNQFQLACEYVYNELFKYKHGPSGNYGNKYIEFLHTTDRYEWFESLVDGVFAFGEEYERNYYLGDYVITYTDGSVYNKRIYLGENIGAHNINWYGMSDNGADNKDFPGVSSKRIDNRIKELASSTIPVKFDDKIYYKYLFENPYPQKTIENIKFVLADNADWYVDVKSIKY